MNGNGITAAPATPYAAPGTALKTPFEASRAQCLAALLSYALAYAYIRLLFLESLFPGALLLFSLLFLGLSELLFRAEGKKTFSRESAFWLCCILAVGLARVPFNGGTVRGWDMLLCCGMAAYYVLSRCGLLIEGETSFFFPFDVKNALLKLPFKNFFLRIRTFCYGVKELLSGKREKKSVSSLAVFITLCALVLFVIAAGILISADFLLSERVGDFFEKLGEFLGELLVPDIPLYFFLSLPVGCYLFGLVSGAARSKAAPTEKAALEAMFERVRVLSVPAAAAILFLFLALYGLFFAFQSSYLVGALSGELPSGFTVSRYAREGFFEMCQIMALSFFLLCCVSKFSRKPLRESRLLKALALLILLSCVLFAVVAAFKLALYIDRYGLTQKRLLSSWGVLVLLIFTLLAAVYISRPFKAAKAAVFSAAALFSLLCLCNPDGLIIRTNLELYKSGAVRDPDLEYLALDCGGALDIEGFAEQLEEAGVFKNGMDADIFNEMLGYSAEETLASGEVLLTWVFEGRFDGHSFGGREFEIRAYCKRGEGEGELTVLRIEQAEV
ncbi:MAG: DUF4173 domain-containing protein [Oscillospiraceae bacterium]|nr:DUF4173 domain-containing protein [Oscillospiraceae bacterium]